MKKLITVLAVAAFITVMAGSAFAAGNIANFVSTRSWEVDGIMNNGTAGNDFGKQFAGNITISASTYSAGGATNASLANFTSGSITIVDGEGTLTANQGNGYLADNSSVYATTSVDLMGAVNGTAQVANLGLDNPFYGYATSDNTLIAGFVRLGLGAPAGQSLITLTDDGAMTPATAIDTNIAKDQQWFFFGIASNGTTGRTAVAGNSHSWIRVGNFTKYGTGAAANATSINAYEVDGGGTRAAVNVNGTAFALNATSQGNTGQGFWLANASAVDFLDTNGYVVFANATMDSNAEVIVSSNYWETNGIAPATHRARGYNNATTFTMALKGATTFDNLAGAWKMIALSPEADEAYIGSFTLGSSNAPTDGTIVRVAAGNTNDPETAADFLTNWTFGVTKSSKVFFPSADFDLSRIVINDAAASRTLTVYGRQLLTSNKNVIAAVGADQAGQDAIVLLIGTPLASDDSDDDDFLGCVFNPAASFGLEWLLLLLAPVAAVLRSRFRK